MLMSFTGCSLFEREVQFAGFSGYVIDNETKLPIEGAVVFVHWQSELVGFEIAGGPSVYLDETVTEKDGYFRFEDSPPLNVKSSMRLRSHAPTMGIVKAGYKFYLSSFRHNEPGWFGPNVYTSLKNEPLRVELSQTSYEQSISYSGMTSIFLRELEMIFRPHRCVPGRLQGTIAQLDTIRSRVRKDALGMSSLYGTVEMIINNSICYGTTR
jgi:hypothetical protein